MRLYELSAEYARLTDASDDTEVGDALAALQDALEVKAERIGFVLRNLAADETALDAELELLRAKRDRVVRQREHLREYVRQCMEASGIEKIACPHFTLSVGQSQPHVVVDDVDSLPAEYVRTKREPDKAAILRAYKQHGECVPGAHVERSSALRIR